MTWREVVSSSKLVECGCDILGGDCISFKNGEKGEKKVSSHHASNWLSASSTSSRVTCTYYMSMYHNQQREIPLPEVKFDLLIDPLFDQFMFAA